MKKLLGLMLVLALALFVVNGCGRSATTAPTKESPSPAKTDQGQGAKQVSMALGTSSSGSGPYASGATMAKLINAKQNAVRISPQVTAGFNENIELVSKGNIQLGMTLESDLIDAYEGKGNFNGKKYENLRKLFTYTLYVNHFVTRESANIKQIKDVEGKKFNMGLRSQATRGLNEDLMKAANVDMSKIKIFELSTGDSFTALQDGVIDATCNAYSIGHGQLVELATNVPVRIIGIPDDVIDKLNEIRKGTLFKVTIPAGTYKGQTENIPTFALGGVIFTRDNVDEESIYQITKAFWENLKELQADPSFKDLKPEYAIGGQAVPLHPGAQKYFKEAGILK